MSGALEASDDTPVAGGVSGEIMLFGVRLVVDSMRKSVSLNNLSQYVHVHPQDPNPNLSSGTAVTPDASASAVPLAGYASSDDVVPNTSSSSSGRERKRGVPWTEDEHRLFLVGLERVGKGDWRGISRNFVKSRTPTQVASHAQKYFLRRSNLNRRRRRSSLFDITSDTVADNPSLNAPAFHQENVAPVLPAPLATPTLDTCRGDGYPMVAASPLLLERNLAIGQSIQVEDPSLNLIGPVSASAAPAPKPPLIGSDLSLSLSTLGERPPSLSLKLSLPPGQRNSAFGAMPSFSNGESIISVA